MRHLVVAIVSILLVCSAAAGVSAAEIEGKIQRVDQSDRSVTLDNGVTLSIVEGMSMDSLQVGTDVKASYEERDGKNIATSIEVAN
jgi:hypothetical protein